MSDSSCRQRRIALPGGGFSLLEAGDPRAPLVICLHGFPDHAPSFAPLLGRLAEAGLHAVAPWTRGYAPSTPDGPFHLDRLAADVLELAEALSPDAPVALVGHDWGALTGYRVATLAPHRLRRLVTMSVPHPMAFPARLPSHPGQLGRSGYIALFQLRGLANWLVWRDDLAFINRLWRRWSPGLVLPADQRRDLHACLRASLPAPLGYYRALLSSPLLYHRATRGQVRVPALYLHGADDGCVAAGMAEGQERFFTAGLQSAVIAGAGHFLLHEQPDRVAGLVVPFLLER